MVISALAVAAIANLIGWLAVLALMAPGTVRALAGRQTSRFDGFRALLFFSAASRVIFGLIGIQEIVAGIHPTDGIVLSALIFSTLTAWASLWLCVVYRGT